MREILVFFNYNCTVGTKLKAILAPDTLFQVTFWYWSRIDTQIIARRERANRTLDEANATTFAFLGQNITSLAVPLEDDASVL